MSGFLMPVQTYLKLQHQQQDELVLKAEQVTALSDTLYASYTRHASIMEKLSNELQTYPFCVETGSILDSEQGLCQIFLLLLEQIPILVDWSHSMLDGQRSVFFDKIEADQGMRLDHGSCRLMLQGLKRYWQQVRVPTMQVLGFMPSDGSSERAQLTAAVVRMSFLDASVRLSIEVSSNRLRLFHLLNRYVPGSLPTMDKKHLTDSGPVLLDDGGAQLRTKGKSALPVRLLLTRSYLFVLSDSGNAKKDKVLEVLPNRSIFDVLLQPDQREVQLQTNASEYGAGAGAAAGASSPGSLSTSASKKSLSNSSSTGGLAFSSRSLTFIFDTARRTTAFQSEQELLRNIASNELTQKSLDVQAEQMRRARPHLQQAAVLPEFPLLMIQQLSMSSDETLSQVFSLPPNEIKVFVKEKEEIFLKKIIAGVVDL